MCDGATCACHLVSIASSCLTSPDAAAESDWSRKFAGSSGPSSVVEGITNCAWSCGRLPLRELRRSNTCLSTGSTGQKACYVGRNSSFREDRSWSQYL